MSVSLPDFLGLVHVASLAADEGFVHFDLGAGATHLDECAALHCASNPVKHEPCRLLSDSERPPYLATGHAIPSVDNHPEGRHPLVHAKRRILEDRADFDRELFVTSTAEPEPPRLDEVIAVGVTARADHFAIGPAEFYGVIKGALRIGEVNDGLL
jgi:hypothetical protein